MSVKYKNKKVKIDDITFDSKKEANRYLVLKQMQNSGLISDLTLQKPFILVSGTRISGELRKRPSVRYIADFVYFDNRVGKTVVEDVKSAITKKDKVYRLKKHLMKTVHNIDILEI